MASRLPKMNARECSRELKKIITKSHLPPDMTKQLLANIEAERKEAVELSGKVGAGNKPLERLRNAYTVLSFMRNSGASPYAMAEFFKGGHFLLDDPDGRDYDGLRALTERQRISSHFRGEKIEGSECGIDCGTIIPELLIFQTHRGLHFQAENSPWGGATSILPFYNEDGALGAARNARHITDALTYAMFKGAAKVFRREVHNLGPYGWSVHDDANPIRALTQADNTPALTQEIAVAPAVGGAGGGGDVVPAMVPPQVEVLAPPIVDVVTNVVGDEDFMRRMEQYPPDFTVESKTQAVSMSKVGLFHASERSPSPMGAPKVAEHGQGAPLESADGLQEPDDAPSVRGPSTQGGKG